MFNFSDFVLPYFRGISSVVRKCTEKRTGKEYAVKIIDISGEKSDDYLAEQTKKDTVREINILRLCTGHPHISKCSGNLLRLCTGHPHISKLVQIQFEKSTFL